MAELKTRKNDGSVDVFLGSVDHERRRADCAAVIQMMREETGERPTMWGGSIVGFGSYHYRYASGREGDWFLTGVSPRKQNLSVYIMPGFDRYGDLLQRLGKHKVGKSCLYINKLEDVDEAVLRELIRESARFVAASYA